MLRLRFIRTEKALNAMNTIYKKLCDAEIVVAAACLLITVFVIFLAAILRTMGNPINWALDIGLLLFTWGVFLGADAGYRDNKFVNVDILFVKLPGSVQRPLEMVMYGIILGFLGLMVYQGSIMSVFTWPRSFQGIPALSYTWVTLSIPLCSLLMIITTGLKIREKYFKKGSGR